MYKRILVHLDSTDLNTHRIDTAVRIARDFGADLFGLHFKAPPGLSGLPSEIPSITAIHTIEAELEAWRRAEDAAAERSRETFERSARDAGIEARFALTMEPAADILAHYARFADLTVVSQDPPELIDAGTASKLAADVAMEAGGPVLVVPYIGSPARIGQRVMVAWNASRESARALGDAMPFLTRAELVSVIGVGETALLEDAPEPGFDVAARLARHGVSAEIRERRTELEPGDEILARLADKACDLLVMGVYGHSRFRETIFGGVTRHILRHMTAPVLMSH